MFINIFKNPNARKVPVREQTSVYIFFIFKIPLYYFTIGMREKKQNFDILFPDLHQFCLFVCLFVLGTVYLRGKIR